jgi:hypothetical protein
MNPYRRRKRSEGFDKPVKDRLVSLSATVTYDNAYMGYACGFNTQSDVVTSFKAAGTAGQHPIDLSPGI